jgi:hypothetical protein
VLDIADDSFRRIIKCAWTRHRDQKLIWSVGFIGLLHFGHLLGQHKKLGSLCIRLFGEGKEQNSA